MVVAYTCRYSSGPLIPNSATAIQTEIYWGKNNVASNIEPW